MSTDLLFPTALPGCEIFRARAQRSGARARNRFAERAEWFRLRARARLGLRVEPAPRSRDANGERRAGHPATPEANHNSTPRAAHRPNGYTNQYWTVPSSRVEITQDSQGFFRPTNLSQATECAPEPRNSGKSDKFCHGQSGGSGTGRTLQQRKDHHGFHGFHG